MPIKRSSEQNDKSLEDFYLELAETNPNFNVTSNKMIQFIRMVNDIFINTQLFGLTSHSRLVIKSEENWNSNWLIVVSNIGADEYYFEYAIPEGKKPWRDAWVKGEAKTLEEAKKYLLISMHETRGWKESIELKELLSQIK